MTLKLTRADWDLILVDREVQTCLEILQASGTLTEVFPVLGTLVGFGGGESGHKDLWAHTKQVVAQTLPDACLRWAALFHDVGKPAAFSREGGKVTFHNHEAVSAKLFREAARSSQLFTAKEIHRINFIVLNLGKVECYAPNWTNAAVRRLGLELGTHIDDVFAVARADCTTGRPAQRQKVLRLTHELRSRVQKLQESDALPPALPTGLGYAVQKKLGVTGPELGDVLKTLQRRVEAGELPRNADYSVYLKEI